MISEIIPEHRWTKNGQKFYTARIERDMLGWWVVQCCWGSMHSRLGNRKTYAFPTRVEAWIRVQQIMKRREARGYTVARDIN